MKTEYFQLLAAVPSILTIAHVLLWLRADRGGVRAREQAIRKAESILAEAVARIVVPA